MSSTKNILIYPSNNCSFDIKCGGIVCSFLLAKYLDELNINVRIYNVNKTQNTIFNKNYNNDLNLNQTIVIYGETIIGNPLNAKYVVRWILGPHYNNEHILSWGKNDLVYYFNAETKFSVHPNKIGNIYKLLSCIYIPPECINLNLQRNNYFCYTMRKKHIFHKKIILPPVNSFKINDALTPIDSIPIFNKYTYFISYDPLTFFSIIAALCGCISIIYPIEGVNETQWLNMTAVASYAKHKNINKLYGIAYGVENISFALQTMHLIKDQWIDIQHFVKEKTLIPFIEDINIFSGLPNIVKNNFPNIPLTFKKTAHYKLGNFTFNK